MRPLAYLRVPLLVSQVPLAVSETTALRAEENTSMFHLEHYGGPERYFYECCQRGCTGAGCPSWPATEPDIPEWVIEHLRTHVELCSGIKR